MNEHLLSAYSCQTQNVVHMYVNSLHFQPYEEEMMAVVYLELKETTFCVPDHTGKAGQNGDLGVLFAQYSLFQSAPEMETFSCPFPLLGLWWG